MLESIVVEELNVVAAIAVDLVLDDIINGLVQGR